MGSRSPLDGSGVPWTFGAGRPTMAGVRIVVLWNACRGISAADDADWAQAEVEKLRGIEGIAGVRLHQVESAALRHPRAWDWCLELEVANGDAPNTVVRSPECAAFLADLRLLGTRPSVLVLPEPD
jgi:hypothetical protein